jgi:hypothetical protein
MRSSKSRLLPLLLFPLIFTPTIYAKTDQESLARKAVSADTKESGAAVAKLRSMGSAGLDALFQAYGREIQQQVMEPMTASTPEWERLSAALDAVSQQRDSYLSGLYWYTDFGRARSAARTSGKPILSLRLLGKLNEEFSCANSRFFRTILYSNGQVSQRLREKFILHWQSVRPAPHITIDFGDGRKLERTITGNSIHYVLDSDGRPIDALPGLYGPSAFARALDQIEGVFKLAKADGIDPAETLRDYHRARLNLISLAWLSDIQQFGGKVPQGFIVLKTADGTPTALQAASLAATKMVTEATILRSMTAGAEALGRITDEALWNRIARLHWADAQLDSRSIGLIQRQTQKVLTAEGSKTEPNRVLVSLVDKLQKYIALDTVRNEYLMHTRLHGWLIADPTRNDVNRLNDKVYAELFLTPASDPWLGLFSPETYMALENGGVVR